MRTKTRTATNRATDKQVRYALHLLDERGYGTEWMSARHRDVGATMRERSGRVEDWLAGMSRQRISHLIDSLTD